MTATEESAKNGTLDFYLGTSAVIPLLLLAYFFNTDTLGYVKKLMEHAKEDVLLLLISIIGLIAPVAGIVGAIAGETACLLALYSGNPSSNNGYYAVGGLIVFVAAGFVHMIIVLIMRGIEWSAEQSRAVPGPQKGTQ
ncbi:hypothetical protein [Streptomyces massasporeus]|uniref:hypothetical protein n=1 Tax=Streptomyces massasporeus TaxID=67324 RepID=UPI0037018791